MSAVKLTEDGLAQMEQFQALLPYVRKYIRQQVPDEWEELLAVARVTEDQPMGPLPILPLASCAAAGGAAHEAVPVAAAWHVLHVAMRILDDLQDQDRPDGLWAEVGVPRAFNFGAVLYVLLNDLLAQAPWPVERYRLVNQEFIWAGYRLLAGQDRDLRGMTRTVEEYWRIIESKNAAAFAMACAAGAHCGTSEPALVRACRDYGHHLGLVLQIFDDFQGFWEPSGIGDLAMGKVTLPVLFGLSVSHEGRDELQRLVDEGNLSEHQARIREIVDAVGAREFMVWTALRERDRALEALQSCPGQAGLTALTAYVTAIFAEIEDVIVDFSELGERRMQWPAPD